MATEKSVASLGKLLGTAGNRAVKAHSGDEVRLSVGGDLPAGIDNGVAQLSSFQIGVYKSGDNQGKPFWMAAGMVVSPKKVTVDGNIMPVEGLRCQTGPHPLCDTTTAAGKEVSLEEHIDHMMNELRKFGVDTSEMTTVDDLQTGWESLVEEAPHFRFRTWKSKATKQYPDPKTNITWAGVVEYEASEEEEAEEFDESELDAEAADGGDEEAQLAIANYAKKHGIDASDDEYDSFASVLEAVNKVISKKGKGKEMAKKKAPAGKKTSKKQMTNEELGAMADEGDEDAIGALTSIAGEYDLDPNDFELWEELGAALDEATTSEDEAEEEEAEEEEESGDSTYAELGQLADDEDEEAAAALSEAAEEAGLDPDDYPTWVALGEELDGGSEEEEEEEESESLGELADNGDRKAVKQLTAAAEEAELDPDDFGTWTELEEAINEASGEEGEEDEEEEGFTPEKGETYSFKPPRAKKAIEGEVTFVSEGQQTVTLRDEEGKLHKNISWDALQG